MEKDLYKTIINPDLKEGDEIIYDGCKAIVKKLIPLEIQLQESIKTMDIEIEVK